MCVAKKRKLALVLEPTAGNPVQAVCPIVKELVSDDQKSLLLLHPIRTLAPHFASVCNSTKFEENTYDYIYLVKKNNCGASADMNCQLEYTSSYL
jgi:hypothetical protein